MGSRVGPAVITARRPFRDCEPMATGSANSVPTISSGSTMRPGPSSPHAWSPWAGPRIRTPRPSSARRFACTDGCCHMAWFIAGASSTGAWLARQSVLNNPSARPAVNDAMKFAVAGATSTRSAQRANSMWPIAASAPSSQRSSRTRRPDTAWNVSGDTNLPAPGVITTCTCAPFSRSRRTISGLLYAATPPVTPRRIRIPPFCSVSDMVAVQHIP